MKHHEYAMRRWGRCCDHIVEYRWPCALALIAARFTFAIVIIFVALFFTILLLQNVQELLCMPQEFLQKADMCVLHDYHLPKRTAHAYVRQAALCACRIHSKNHKLLTSVQKIDQPLTW